MNKEAKFDSNEETWKNVYNIVYKENLNAKERKQNQRLQKYAEFTYNGKKSKKMYFSGDIIFNFLEDTPKKRGKRRLYTEMMSLLELEEKKEGSKYSKDKMIVIKEKLIQANKRTNKKANVSIMPSTGGLQFVKQSVGRDRIDTFVWCLDEHYRYNKTVLFNHCAAAYMDELKSFLNLFDSAADYCKCIYNISENMTEKLIASGTKPIDTPQRVEEYVDLANEFWNERIEFFISLNMEKVED